MNKCEEFVARKAMTTFLAFVALDGPLLWPSFASLTLLYSAFWPWSFQNAKWNPYLRTQHQTTSTKVIKAIRLYNFFSVKVTKIVELRAANLEKNINFRKKDFQPLTTGKTWNIICPSKKIH